jgi:hypothetical protein
MTYAPPITDDGIRPYGPGKFDTLLDAYVYQVSLLGPDREIGESGYGPGYFCAMYPGHSIFVDHDPFLEDMTPLERKLLLQSAGVILSEQSDGFVYVTYYESMGELEQDWQDIEDGFQDIEDGFDA